jgi:phosphoesterase RecJ-like protein
MKGIMTKETNKLKELLETPKSISLIIHRNPDGDAIGSGLGLKKILEKKGHKVWLISPNIVPDYLNWMPGSQEIIINDNEKEKVKKVLQDSDLIFTLDFNDLSRTGEDFGKELEQISGKKFIMIDHHLYPKDYADIRISDSSKSSTAEMIYDLIVALGEKDMIDEDIATNLYTGIMTDTGSFKFPATSPHTMKVAGELMEKGAQHNQIQTRIYDSFSKDKIDLLGQALKNMVFLPQYKTAYITLTQDELKKFNYKKGDTEGFVNYGLSLADSDFAVMFMENEDGSVRISFRSKGNFPANEFAARFFNGGGHKNAAGGRTDLNIKEAVELFLKELPVFYKNYKEKHV